MNIRIDKFIKTGKTHFLCEDYILSGPNYIILSDGCSAVDDSDIGARLLCLAAMRYLNIWKYHMDDIDYMKMGGHIINSADVMARTIGISSECLMSTLIISFYFAGRIYVFMYGDGYIITVDKSDKVNYYEITFTNSCPFYLSYYLTPQSFKSYISGNIVKTIKWSEILDTMKPDLPVQYSFPVDQFKTIAIASDGISSFKPQVDIASVVDNCVIYKNTIGPFLQKRMTRFLFDFEKRGIFHGDDISIGAYYMED